MLREFAALGSAAVLFGCSSSTSSTEGHTGGGGSTLPPSAVVQAFTHASNIFLVEVDVAGTRGVVGVDTGSPFLVLNPATFPDAPAVGNVSSVAVESATQTDVPVITTSQSPASPDPGIPLGGLLGCTVLCGNVVSFDYRSAAFTVGATAPPTGLEPETVLDFPLKGGGTAQLNGTEVTIPTSRIVVSVDIEGAPHTMIVDTGASFVVVNAALFAEITKDGRGQLAGGTASTTSGTSAITLARMKTISLGGATATGVVVAHDASFDENLATLTKETGETVEGSLGGTFLTSFYVTIDYPSRKLHLAPYSDKSFLVDPAVSLGITLGKTPAGGFTVAKVTKGSDADAKGVVAGDTILSVDGKTLAGLTQSEVAAALGGQAGATKSVAFGDAKTLAKQTVAIKLVDLVAGP